MFTDPVFEPKGTSTRHRNVTETYKSPGLAAGTAVQVTPSACTPGALYYWSHDTKVSTCGNDVSQQRKSCPTHKSAKVVVKCTDLTHCLENIFKSCLCDCTVVCREVWVLSAMKQLLCGHVCVGVCPR